MRNMMNVILVLAVMLAIGGCAAQQFSPAGEAMTTIANVGQALARTEEQSYASTPKEQRVARLARIAVLLTMGGLAYQRLNATDRTTVDGLTEALTPTETSTKISASPPTSSM